MLLISKFCTYLHVIWHYQFKDCRLIVEQSGNLNYLYITANHQRFCLRTLLTTIAVALIIGSSTISYYFYLHFLNANLTHSNVVVNKKKQIAFEALAAASNIPSNLLANMSDKELQFYASRMRERDKNIMQLVEFAASDLAQANKTLELALSSSGLSKAKINQLKSEKRNISGQGGAPNPIIIDSTLETMIAGHIKTNQQLKDVLNMVPNINPIPGSRISSSYGVRQHPVTGRLDMHPGIDFVPVNDHNIFSPLAGKVTFAGSKGSYGNTVIIEHPGNIETLFAHLEKINVKTGASVKKQQLIGVAGNSGLSTGTHLHYELRVDGVRINPLTPIAMAKSLNELANAR